jgi:hypothetical protein
MSKAFWNLLGYPATTPPVTTTPLTPAQAQLAKLNDLKKATDMFINKADVELESLLVLFNNDPAKALEDILLIKNDIDEETKKHELDTQPINLAKIVSLVPDTEWESFTKGFIDQKDKFYELTTKAKNIEVLYTKKCDHSNLSKFFNKESEHIKLLEQEVSQLKDIKNPEERIVKEKEVGISITAKLESYNEILELGYLNKIAPSLSNEELEAFRGAFLPKALSLLTITVSGTEEGQAVNAEDIKEAMSGSDSDEETVQPLKIVPQLPKDNSSSFFNTTLKGVQVIGYGAAFALGAAAIMNPITLPIAAVTAVTTYKTAKKINPDTNIAPATFKAKIDKEEIKANLNLPLFIKPNGPYFLEDNVLNVNEGLTSLKQPMLGNILKTNEGLSEINPFTDGEEVMNVIGSVITHEIS